MTIYFSLNFIGAYKIFCFNSVGYVVSNETYGESVD